MRRGVNGADALETINAAATAIASAETRGGARASVQKRRWGSCWSLYWCFRSNKNKRIGHAVLVPEPTTSGTDAPTIEHPSQLPSIVLPFVAPPSSPASFLSSEPPSATQSPTGLLSLTSPSADMMYSPGGPASIFAIGPYAHETQLVSPPVFSTFTTEPSTAPYTPPPESVHLATPSSPEVPFARLLEPNLQNSESGQRYPLYEFQSYQLQPGSPVSHLISPSSGISGSGTSSPFPDHPFFLQFRTGNPPQLLDLEKIVLREWESRQGAGAGTPDAVGPKSHLLNRQDSDISPLPETSQIDGAMIDHRVSFEITDKEVVRCVEKKPVVVDMPKSALESVENNVEHRGDEKPIRKEYVGVGETSITSEKDDGGCENEHQHQKNRTITLGSTKEFNFDGVDGGNSDEPSIGSSEWWVNDKVPAEGGDHSNWSFFPILQTGVS